MNADKYHLLIAGNKHEYMFVRLANDIIWEQESVLLLGIAIDIPLAKTRLIQ